MTASTPPANRIIKESYTIDEIRMYADKFLDFGDGIGTMNDYIIKRRPRVISVIEYVIFDKDVLTKYSQGPIKPLRVEKSVDGINQDCIESILIKIDEWREKTDGVIRRKSYKGQRDVVMSAAPTEKRGIDEEVIQYFIELEEFAISGSQLE